MNTLVLLTLFALTTTTYEKAYKAYQADGTPMLIEVGADWCPGCVTLKGKLRRFRFQKPTKLNYVEINTDTQEAIYESLKPTNRTIPKLFMFKKVDGIDAKVEETNDKTPQELEKLLEDFYNPTPP